MGVIPIVNENDTLAVSVITNDINAKALHMLIGSV
jgi:glutamate 5-kinase